MADAFDPYYMWLGIGPEEQPANHYRLLGIRLFEPNSHVIDNAADRQLAHLRTFQTGENGSLTQRLMNEVAAARICLLNPQKRAAYDLRIQSAAGNVGMGSAIGRGTLSPPLMPSGAATGASTPQPGGSQIRRSSAPLPAAQTLPTAAALSAPAPVDKWDELIGDGPKSPARTATKSGQSGKASVPYQLIGIAVAIVLAFGAGAAFIFLRGPTEGVLTFDWPPADRAGATLTIDGQPIAIPDTGPWEFRAAPGEHRIVAQRPAFKMETSVSIAGDSQQTVAAPWKPKAELILTWPVAERAGAKLTIDGHLQAASQRDSIELPMEPGRHIIHAARSGAEPFDATVALADGERRTLAASTRLNPLLVVNLPVDERNETKLQIDGEPAPLDKAAVILEFHLKPGEHSIHVERPGFKPFDETVTLAASDNKTVSPVWASLVPNPANTAATDDKKDPGEKSKPLTNPTADVAPPPVKKFAIPSRDEQQKIAKDLDSVYKVTHVPEKDQALVEQMLKTADEPGSRPAERYMLLMRGAGLAAELGELDAAFRALDTVDAAFEIDAPAEKRTLLDEAVKSANSTDRVLAIAAAAQSLASRAAAADQYDAALEFIAAGKKATAKRPDEVRVRKEWDEPLTQLRREITGLQTAYAAVADAQKTLAKTPNDAAANLAVGRWYCLLKRDWSRGLPLLAKGSDERLQALAKLELAGADAKTQLEVADGWWDAAQKESGVAQDCVRLHAGEIYRVLLPSLESPLKKIAIEQRLKEIADLKAALSPDAATAAPEALQYAVNEYSWKVGQPNARLIQKNKGFCFLAAVSGDFSGYGEAAGVHFANGGFWSLDAHSGKDSLMAQAISIERLAPVLFKSRVTEYRWRNGEPRVRMLQKNGGICFLSAIEGHFAGPGEKVSVRVADDGYWYLEGKSGQQDLGAGAIGLELARPDAYSIEAEEHNWSAGNSPVRLLEKAQGFAFLSSVSGAFRGGGEEIKVSLGEDGVWYLAGRSGEKSLHATATAIRVSRTAAGHTPTP